MRWWRTGLNSSLACPSSNPEQYDSRVQAHGGSDVRIRTGARIRADFGRDGSGGEAAVTATDRPDKCRNLRVVSKRRRLCRNIRPVQRDLTLELSRV
jgi:hypothetical protein